MAFTKALLFDQLAKACDLADETNKFARANTDNYKGKEVLIVGAASEGPHIQKLQSSLRAARVNMGNTVAGMREIVFTILAQLAKTGYNSVSKSEADIINDLVKGMHAATETIKYRNFTRGSVTAGGANVGTGTILRTLYDAKGYSLEGSVAGALKFQVMQDKNSGARMGNEKFKAFGNTTTQYVDDVDPGDTTAEEYEGLFRCGSSNSIESGSILKDASFTTVNPANSVLNQPGSWTLSDAGGVKIVKSDTVYYRLDQGAEKGYSIYFTEDGSVKQYFSRSQLKANANVGDNYQIPYILTIAWMRKNSADGTLTLRLGSQTETATVSSASNDAWNRLSVGIGTSKKGYLEVFNEDWPVSSIPLGNRVSIELSSNTTGEVYVDEVILAPAFLFNGVPYLAVAGSSDMLVGDYFTFSDTVADTGIMQKIIAQYFGRSLPHTSGSPTYADA